MAIEIERKFLVTNDGWREHVQRKIHIVDHLIARFDKGKARVRICGSAATLTVKGNRRGLVRSEFHLPLSIEEARAMIGEFSAGLALEKFRHDVDVAGLVWQVDEYAGTLRGLVTADVELPDEQFRLTMPPWAGREITANSRFSSAALAECIGRNVLEPA